MSNPNGVKSWPQDDQSWLADLAMLLLRHSDLGIGADVAAMCPDELRGLYRFLVRREKEMEVCDEE